MKFCSHCGTELQDDAVFCVKCGYNTMSSQLQTNEDEYPGLTLLSLLFPAIGFLLFFLYKEDQPLKAIGCRKGALVGLVVGFVLMFLAVIATVFS